ncbi:MAG: M48 family metallopeptidase [Proteobacteria bacterium]|nr:M48 family metallopeptidase [Pseudomonadota bacterium]MBU4010747.1 M48 family metallopeptidase [Pseudomonadota bacterium]
MHNTVFYIFIGIILFDFVLERTINYLNSRNWSDELPEEVRDVYDAEKYRKSQEYKKANDKFSILTSSFNLVLILLMLFLGGFAFFDSISQSLVQNSIAIPLVFFAILMFCADIINTPFAVYDTFVIEEKFGFNKTTPKTFILDKLKGWMLSAVIGGGLLALFVLFYQATGKLFWIYAWIVTSVFMIFMAMFYSTLIVPLFNKQTPLEEGELKNSINEFAQKAGFKLDNVFVIDGSKRSSKANAYFSGLGAKKRIVLFDTLINDLTTEEIVAVLAHEIGHYKKKHTLTGMIISIIQMGVTLYLLSLFIGSPALSEALGSQKASFHMGLIAFGLLYSPISATIGLIMNAFSRKNEYEADNYTKSFNLGEQLISSLKKLSRNNLSNLTPHPAYVFFHYSHPTLLQRIRSIRKQ